CGKTFMDNQQRSSCIDLLPTCEKLCERILSCGSIDDPHQCLSQCHNGPCPSCSTQIILQCRCGKSSKSISCVEAIEYDPIENPFRCKQKCKTVKSCKTHQCSRICCNLDSHQCNLVCGKILNCNIHKCEELCHSKFCHTCSLFDQEIKCHCGKTVLKPKSKCLKILQKCYFSCKREHECGHPANHWCHNDDECPPCTHPVSKMCVGKHMSFDVPCHVKIVCCRQGCGKFLPCGVHTCQRSCHSDSCQSFDQKCTQRCNIKRYKCGHKCNLVCHGSEPCPVTTCEAIIKVRCPCDSDFNLTSHIEALKLYIENSILARKRQQQQQQLECDDECRVIQENKNLTQPFSINLDEPRQLPTVYTEFLPVRRLIQFYSFTAMKFHERYLIHQLAPFYGLQTQAIDREPNRKIVACASYGICKIPSIPLSETIVPEKL
ncbi:unnamed protein product, partial [Rotaria sp. Silwood2]